MSRHASSLLFHETPELSVRGDRCDTLYGAHFDFVYRCLRRLGVLDAHAEDAAQDTFVVLHRRLADLREDASPRAFLFAIATRVARHYRRKQVRASGPVLPERDERPGENPFERTASEEAARVLERFLATLEEEQRVVFMLMELEELTAPEISQALGVNLNTVYSRLRLARERLVRFLRAEGGLR